MSAGTLYRYDFRLKREQHYCLLKDYKKEGALTQLSSDSPGGVCPQCSNNSNINRYIGDKPKG